MQIRTSGSYEIAEQEVVAEGADMRVIVMTLAAGQSVPWHFHSEITDNFVCLEGQLVVETRAPRAVAQLAPGERFAVAPKTAHTTCGKDKGPCKFMLIQGVGVYDYAPVGS